MGNGTYYMDGNSSSSSRWNVAGDFTKIKIARHLIEIDQNILVALYGTENLSDEFYLLPNIVKESRIKALSRLATSLEMIIDNCTFAIHKTDKDNFKEFKKKIIVIRNLIPKLHYKIMNSRDKTSEFMIHEEQFNKILDYLRTIHQDILAPLDKAQLIFSGSDEFDPDELKKQIYQEAVENG